MLQLFMESLKYKKSSFLNNHPHFAGFFVQKLGITFKDLVDQAIGGIKSGMYYVEAKNIKELHKKAKFLPITQVSLNESHPHGVLVTNYGSNYS